MAFDLYSWLTNQSPPEFSPGTMPLTNVRRVRDWINPDQGNLVSQSDKTLARTILGVSRLAMSAMNRDTLARVVRTERYKSIRTLRLALRSWPAFGLTSVKVGLAAARVDGFSIELPVGGAQCLVASPSQGVSLWGGAEDIEVVYQSGFVKYEDLVVPPLAPYVVTPSSAVLMMEGVIDPTTEAAVPYTVRSDGDIDFASNKANATVRLIYSYVPEDIEQVVIEETALAFRSRQRIGEASKALANGGGTVSYVPRELGSISRMVLDNYKNRAPL